jgi:hypothetical protein
MSDGSDSTVTVIVTDLFADWYGSITDAEAEAVNVVVRALEVMGTSLGYPVSSAIKGSSIALRELRATADKSELRVFYAFDPARDAVLIVGGDKTNDKRFYTRMIAIAEKEWSEYLADNFPTK